MAGAVLMFWVTCLRSAVFGALFAGTVLALSSCSSSEDRAQAHYERGLELVAAGDPIKAGLEFRNALKFNDALVDALFQLGVIEEQQGHFDTAARIFISVGEKDPQHVTSRVRLVYILLAAGQVDEALKFAQQATDIAGQDPQTLVAMAAVQLRLDNRGEARSLAQAVLEKYPQNVDALMLLASERIIASDLGGALSLLDQTPADGERNIGLQLLRLSVLDAMDDQPGVEALLKRLSVLFPETSAFPISLVKWYASKGRSEEAITAMRQYAAEHPDDDGIQASFISFLTAQQGSEEALAEARRIVAARKKTGGNAFSMNMTIAQLQFEMGNQADAIKFMESVIEDANNDDNRNYARIALARMAAIQKNWDKAAKLADSVIDNDPKNVDALRVRASILLVEGNVDKAIDDLLTALNEAPDDVQLHGLLGGAYERKGLVVIAGEQYGKAMMLDKKSPASGLPYAQFLLRYGRADQAMNVLEGVRVSAPTDRQVLTLLGQLKLNARDWVGAQQIAETLRQLDTGEKDSTADRIAAAALSGLNRFDDSISLLRSSMSVNADLPGMLTDLVRAYVTSGKLPAAEQFLQSTLVENPSNVEAHILLGSVYTLTDRIELAQEAFLAAAAADKGGSLGEAALAQFYLSRGKAAEAETTLIAAVKSDGNNPVLRSILGTIYQQQERFDEAIAQYELLFAANPESTAAANDLASLLSERRGGPEALARAFEIAQRFQTSQVPQFLDTLGWIYYLRGEHAASLPLLKTAADGLPKVALVQFHLGMALKELGQRSTAIAKLKEAVSLSPPLISIDLDKAKNALEQLQQGVSAPAETTDNARTSQ
jgi:tetratricopeptide (TPR) repeat protein